jgi:hypothetical protein
MPTDYENEPDENNDETEENFFEKYGLDALNITTPLSKLSPEEAAEIKGRVRCAWAMSDARTAELNAVAEKWLDHFIAGCKDTVVPRSKEKMLRLLTDVVLPTGRMFGLHDDADLEQKVTPDQTAIELLIESVDDYLYGDDQGIRVRL